jgi:hypothetical protein
VGYLRCRSSGAGPVHAPGDTAVFDLGPLLSKSLLNLNNFQQLLMILRTTTGA